MLFKEGEEIGRIIKETTKIQLEFIYQYLKEIILDSLYLSLAKIFHMGPEVLAL